MQDRLSNVRCSEKPRKILYIQYTSPSDLPPLERSAVLFKRQGWAVSFLGSAPDGQSNKLTSALKSSYDTEMLTHYSGGLSALSSYIRFWWRALQRVWREKPDVVYVSDSLAYPVGLLISLTFRTIVIQHEHDTPISSSFKERAILALRVPFMRRADISINPQADRAAALRSKISRDDIMVVYNCPLLNEFQMAVPFNEKPPGLTLWHHGSLGPGRLPYSIIDALQYLPEDVTFSFAGYETVNTKGFVNSLMARAKAIGVAHRVMYYGAIPAREDLYAEASRAHVGMAVFIADFVEPMAGASNKPFDFLGCTLALIVNNTDEWRGFLGDKCIGMFCDPESPTDIAQAVEALYNDRKKLADMATRGRELVEKEWNYDTQFKPVLDRIEGLLKAKKT